ncbi:MAG TPA: PfkB family carbohydrate kinase [Armatimonadota bacterium]|nr:PfkB family carbohydrate kinase [Armatimonadota bacterium]
MDTPRPIACIGDNVVDVFRDRRRAYPGGNAYNVAAYAALIHKAPASFTGIVGDDEFGDHIVATLRELDIDAEGIRRAHGPSGQALVDVARDGDRIFVGSNRGGVQRSLSLRLTHEDEQRLAASRLIHTSIYSGIDHLLPRLAELAPVSYDFSEAPEMSAIQTLLPHISVACFSGAHLGDKDRRALGRRVLAHGPEVALVTAGRAGAYAYTTVEEHHEAIVPTSVVDALGAGDSFITGFLHHWTLGASVAAAMAEGARSGAAACRFEGAFGHPVAVSAEQIAAITAGVDAR